MLRLSTRKLGAASSSFAARRAPQPLGRSCSLSSVSDRQIQNEFDSIQNKFKLALQLFDANERNKFYELQRQQIIPMKPTLLAILFYVELQNPLLTKYRVDMSDFRKGALYAFDKAYRAISSKDLADYIAGEGPSSPSYDLLKDTMNSTLFNAFTDACKELRAKRVSSVLTDLTIKNMTMCDLGTRIVPGDVPEGTEFMTDLERAVFKEMEEKASKFWGALAEEEDAAAAAAKLKSGEGSSSKQQGNRGASAVNTAAVGNASATAAVQPVVPPTAASAPAAASAASAPVVSAPPTPAVVAAAPAPARADSAPSAAPAFAMESRPQPATRSALKVRSATAAVPTSPHNTVAAPAAAPAASVSAPVTPVVPSSSSAASASVGNAAAQPANASSAAPEGAQQQLELEPDTAVESEVEKEVELSAYPPGSVVASVVMQFDVHEEYETTMLSAGKGAADGATEAGTGTAVASVKNSRTSSVKWTFRGCISGQVPLQWTVVAFDGIGAANSKY